MIYTKDTIIGNVTTYETFEGEVKEIIELINILNEQDKKPATIVQNIQLDSKGIEESSKEVKRKLAMEILNMGY